MSNLVRLEPPLPDDDAAGRVVLRDGSVAALRPTTGTDLDALQRFFTGLSAESRRQRFQGSGDLPASVMARLCDSSDPREMLTIVAERIVDGEVRIVAVGSYFRAQADAAEVAFAVADGFQGRGLGTALLERLAAAAAHEGFATFVAVTLADNVQMLDVFRDSGFEIRARSEQGVVDVALSLRPAAATAAMEDERHRIATAASLAPLLRPRAVAVIGASRDPRSIGRRILDGMRAASFAGPIYAVNPHATEIAGVPAYPTARDLPPGVDLGVIAVPAPAVLDVVDACAAAGIRALVIITAGFAEAGADGRALQDRLTASVRRHGMRMVGPNCMGILNTDPAVRLNASFSPVFPPSGRVGFLSQSGALGIAILALAAEREIGLSAFVSAGNKADVSGNDLLEYWDSDPHTSVILLYLESFGNPRRFARLARRIGRRKPIVAVKSGRTRAGTRAASSHTAALAASDVAVDALFRQSGVVRADTLDEMFDIAALLETQPLPPGRRVAVVTNAGGPGILAADACEAAGLALPDFSVDTRARLAECLPANASTGNPVDMIASAGPDAYRDTLARVLTAPEVDALIVIFTPVEPGTAEPILQAIRDGIAAGRAAGASGKPVLACVMAEAGTPKPISAGGERIPAYPFPENAARALGKVAAYAAWRAQTPGLFWGFDDVDVAEGRAICRRAIHERGDTWLTGEEVRALLTAFGMPLAPSRIVSTPEEAVAAAVSFGLPVALKLSSTRIQHKSDVGGVRLNLQDGDAVSRAFVEIMSAAAPGDPDARVLVQPMIAGGVETMMGVAHDPLFGPLVGFGLGGIHVEILGDVQFRIAPLTDRDVDDLLHGIRGFRLLQGYRGHAAADLDALRQTLFRLSRLADAIPAIAEIDFNPVIALAPGQGCRIVDARIRVTGN